MSEAPVRRCGECTLCCTVLRVDEIGKLGGEPCAHQGAGGCAIHASRPAVCRGYRCLWLRGGLDEADRPDRLGAVVDLVHPDALPTLYVREAMPGAFEGSPRLREIAERHREGMSVRIVTAGDVLDPERPVRVLLAGGEEQWVRGDRVEVHRPGQPVEVRRLPWLERAVRRLGLALERRKLGRFPARAARFRSRTGTGP